MIVSTGRRNKGKCPVIKSILSVVEDPDKAEAFLHILCAMAERLDAHLEIVALTLAPVAYPSIAPLGSLYVPERVLKGDEDDRLARIRTIVSRVGDRANVSGLHDDVAWLTGDLRHSRPVADLVVIATDESWTIDWLRHRVIRTLVMSAGAPVLLLPPGRSLGTVTHGVLACQSSPEVMRALHDLLSIVEPGAKVDVLTIGVPPDTLSDRRRMSEEVVRHLRRHGLAAEALWRNDGESVADQLQTYALENGADLLVIGAYAHSRVREIVLGGVTQALVDNPRLPVLLSR